MSSSVNMIFPLPCFLAAVAFAAIVGSLLAVAMVMMLLCDKIFVTEFGSGRYLLAKVVVGRPARISSNSFGKVVVGPPARISSNGFGKGGNSARDLRKNSRPEGKLKLLLKKGWSSMEGRYRTSSRRAD
eukprot:scaffold15842_cov113-Cylindrotheca_fusiformis.AAC.1